MEKIEPKTLYHSQTHFLLKENRNNRHCSSVAAQRVCSSHLCMCLPCRIQSTDSVANSCVFTFRRTQNCQFETKSRVLLRLDHLSHSRIPSGLRNSYGNYLHIFAAEKHIAFLSFSTQMSTLTVSLHCSFAVTAFCKSAVLQMLAPCVVVAVVIRVLIVASESFRAATSV